MPILSPDSGYWTVFNVFRTDSEENQNRLLSEMQQIVDAAAYDGWISSTVHSGEDKLGTANFIQWRQRGDLENRYASDEFQHQIPLFANLTTWIKLLQTEVVYAQKLPALGGPVEISATGDDYTVIDILSVEPENLDTLVAALGKGREWLFDVPGYRSHSVLRGKALRGRLAQPLEGGFAVSYAQWDSKEAYDAFRTLPEKQQPAERRRTQDVLDSLVTEVEWNTYRVHHTRSAGA